MMRSVVIFSFFALATVLVIVLQPGPRSTYAYEAAETIEQETSRNFGGVLETAKTMPVLEAPDDVLGRLKAASEPEAAPAAVQPQSNGTSNTGSLTRLQAALDASLGNEPVVSDVEPVPAPRVETVIEPSKPMVSATYSAVEPELRDMSWQTLNTLNSLGHEAKGPGQEGSLLNSIVRRSMGQVGNAPAPARIAAPAPRAAPKPQVVAAAPVKRVQAAALAPAPQKAVRQTAVQSTYVVASGDTLALIAIKLYGTALAIDDLLAQNPSLRSNPNSLRIGQVLQYAAN